MNAPLPESVLRALQTVSLDDKYTLDHGRAFMSGVQALVRLPMLQRQRDARAGLRTAGFVSGYRGSPLGGVDQALWQAKQHLAAQEIVFQPGVNEELAATAVWGSQQLDLFPERRKFDGVFGLWYGKGPGVDRCVDVFKHANLAGTSRHGGVIAVAGDDHVAKSSTAAHQSDHVFKACGMPVFFPSSVQEILDLGLHAFALSRFAGVWTGMKTIQEVVESSASVMLDSGDAGPGTGLDGDRVPIILPEDFRMPPGGLHMRWPDSALEQEARLMDYKWYAALAYIRANRLNCNVVEGPNDRYGIIASGKAWNDLRQALADLGLDDDTCRQLGIRLHKVGVVWPLEANITRDFAMGLQEILVVEEKRQIIEYQLKEELYNWRADVRPDVLGKFDEPDGDHSGGEWSHPNPSENWLLRAKADLTPAIIAKAVARRLKRIGVPADIAARMDRRLEVIEAKERSQAALVATTAAGERQPWFCSGCPHNTSTRVPEGSRALAGIGCHYMSIWMDRSTVTYSQMGGEGVAWVGQAPFSQDEHVFANLGDGTYFHSGLLAMRQSIAAGVNITYKILYNDAVAMTGGQPVDGILKVPEMTRELHAEGVKRIVIVTDEPEKYGAVRERLAPDVTVHHRDELDAVQRDLRATRGCTALIYDQTCATEKRRRRKRGLMVDPAERVVINELVCEGCGDCGTQSNCLSVEPVETELGRKRRINQSSCNKDFSCVKGFCPSFVTVQGGQLRKPKAADRPDPDALPELTEPDLPDCTQPWGIVVAGVGGTGVITIGQLLGVAAHIEGKGVVTQDAAGLAQKGGATWSHIQIAHAQPAILTTKVDVAKADLVLGCDAIVTAQRATLALMREGTFVALNTHATPTASFVRQPDWQFPAASCERAISGAIGDDHLARLDAERIATALLGDSIYTNPLLLGVAWQRGRVPLGRQALRRAIELNGTQVAANLAAFEWGRRCAADLGSVMAQVEALERASGHNSSRTAPGAAQVVQFIKRTPLAELIERRAAFLAAYQDAAYAQRYRDVVERVRNAESAFHSTRVSEAVARNLFKLMAYKDEYEVARLHTDAAFTAQIAAGFEGDYTLVHHLAPPFLARRNAAGELVKQRYAGVWVRPMLKLLARGKVLRGTWLDPFGRSAERRTERALINEYLATLDELLAGLRADRLQRATELAAVPDQIRGYGHVKVRHLEAARARWQELLQAWRTGVADPQARASA